MKIEVKSSEIEIRRGTSPKTGKPYELKEQWARMHHDDEIRKFKIILGRDQSPYAPGVYVIGADSYRVNDFGDLIIGRLVLTPVGAGVTKVA